MSEKPRQEGKVKKKKKKEKKKKQKQKRNKSKRMDHDIVKQTDLHDTQCRRMI